MTSAIGKSRRARIHPRRRNWAGFTLVELLSVVAIMAIVMGALGYAISNMGGPSTQVAAAQVASGLSLARQYAVAKNLETRFVICNLEGSSGDGLPSESWRYWTVIQTNRGSNNWTMMKEWEKMPAGVVFLNLAVGDYSVIAGDPIGAIPGQPFKPVFNASSLGSGKEWTGFGSFTNQIPVVVAGSTKKFTLGSVPAIGFRGTGSAVRGDGAALGTADMPSYATTMAVRVALGAVTPDNSITLKATNNYYYIETDVRGRVRVRSPESFRQ